MASDNVGSIHYDLDLDTSKFDDATKKVGDTMSDFGKKAAVGFAAVGAGLTLLSKNATDFTVDFVKDAKGLARTIGTTTEEASRLTAAFGRMGISAQDASTMFGIFSKNVVKSTEDVAKNKLNQEKVQIAVDKTKMAIQEITDEIKKHGDKTGELDLKIKALNNTLASQKQELTDSKDAFGKLGVSTVNAQGTQKDFNTLLFEVADKFKAMPDGIDKTALSMELFGRSGKDMVKVLNLGSDGIQELEKEADRLGLTLTSDTIANVSDFIKSQKDLKQSTDAMKIAIGTATTPVITSFNEHMNAMVQKLLQADGPIKAITVGFLAFGGPIMGAISGIITFGSSFAQLITSIGPAITIIKNMTAVQWLLNAALWANPITWVILALVALVAAFAIAYTQSEAFRNFVAAAFDWVKNAAISLWNWIKQNWMLLLGILTLPFGGAVLIIIQYWDQVMNFIKAVPGRIAGFFSGISNLLYNSGRDLIHGFLEGAGSLLKTVGQFFINKLPGWIQTPFKKALGIASPSKVFAGFGTNIVQGLAEGISGAQDLAFNAVDSMSNMVMKPTVSPLMTDPISKSNTPGSTTINIGTIQNQSDADYIFRRMNRDQQRVNLGVSPAY